MTQPQYNDTDFTALENHVFDITVDTFVAGDFTAYLDGGPYVGSGVDAEAVRDLMKTAIDAGTHVGWSATDQGTNAIRITALGPGQHIGGGPSGMDSLNPSVVPPPGGAISITDVTPFEGIDFASLQSEIEANVVITTPLVLGPGAIEYLTLGTQPRVIQINFQTDPLPGPEKTELDSLVAAFTNTDTATILTQFIRTSGVDVNFIHHLANLVLATKGAPDFGIKLVSLNLVLGSTKGYITGLIPRSNQPTDTSEVIITPGCCADEDNTVLMSLATQIIIDIDASGVNGLDTGSKANSTWYYVFLIAKDDGTTRGLFSLTLTPTMPSGYTKRRWVGNVKTDSSGDITDYRIYGDGGELYYIWSQDRSVSPFRVKSGGSSTSFADISLSGVIPLEAHWIKLVVNNTNSPTLYMIERDDNGGIDQPYGSVRIGGNQTENPEMGVDDNRKIQYVLNSSGGSVYIDIVGYKIDRSRFQ